MDKLSLKIALFLVLIISRVTAATIVCYDDATKVVNFYKQSVNTPDYSGNANCLINPTLPDVDKKYWIYNDGSIVEMTTEQKDQFYLESEKQKKKDEIDARTTELILEGFVYDGEVFSLTDEAKINWTNLVVAKNVLMYPVTITMSNGSSYELANPLAIDNFYAQGIGTVKARYDSGRAIKDQVDLCTTLSNGCLDDIVDNR